MAKSTFALVTALLALTASAMARKEQIHGKVNRDGSVTAFGTRRTTSSSGNIYFSLVQFPECADLLYLRVNPTGDKPPFDWRKFTHSDFGRKISLGNGVLSGTTFTIDARLSPAVNANCETSFSGPLEWN
ncbi:uncharacterized protein VTP21DRAFT_7800 [Calcarisporiella thermophila]|uniref:uncharacterized protein n=1 Tax=Calcarisporiella thermophila TaxID=911321 RepID=UPI003742D0B9